MNSSREDTFIQGLEQQEMRKKKGCGVSHRSYRPGHMARPPTGTGWLPEYQLFMACQRRTPTDIK